MQHFSSILEPYFKQKNSFLLCTFKESANPKRYWSSSKLLTLQQISPAASLGSWLLYTLLRNYGDKTFTWHKNHEVLTTNRYYSLPQTVDVTARVWPNKATSLGIFQHITHSNPKVTITQDGSFKLLPFKTRRRVCIWRCLFIKLQKLHPGLLRRQHGQVCHCGLSACRGTRNKTAVLCTAQWVGYSLEEWRINGHLTKHTGLWYRLL